jgi:hypothetical protein
MPVANCERRSSTILIRTSIRLSRADLASCSLEVAQADGLLGVCRTTCWKRGVLTPEEICACRARSRRRADWLRDVDAKVPELVPNLVLEDCERYA